MTGKTPPCLQPSSESVKSRRHGVKISGQIHFLFHFCCADSEKQTSSPIPAFQAIFRYFFGFPCRQQTISKILIRHEHCGWIVLTAWILFCHCCNHLIQPLQLKFIPTREGPYLLLENELPAEIRAALVTIHPLKCRHITPGCRTQCDRNIRVFGNKPSWAMAPIRVKTVSSVIENHRSFHSDGCPVK